ncbi:MAG TPA: hypothetical protein VF533_00155 [Solirubrobacteraceae bacterium]|jgi:hypothetical protein
MHLSSPTSTRRRERSTRRRQAPLTRHVVSAAEARARRSGGPQDQALYSCGCGCAFTAEVSTSVGCPHCGQAQAW